MHRTGRQIPLHRIQSFTKACGIESRTLSSRCLLGMKNTIEFNGWCINYMAIIPDNIAKMLN